MLSYALLLCGALWLVCGGGGQEKGDRCERGRMKGRLCRHLPHASSRRGHVSHLNLDKPGHVELGLGRNLRRDENFYSLDAHTPSYVVEICEELLRVIHHPTPRTCLRLDQVMGKGIVGPSR